MKNFNETPLAFKLFFKKSMKRGASYHEQCCSYQNWLLIPKTQAMLWKPKQKECKNGEEGWWILCMLSSDHYVTVTHINSSQL